MLSIPIYDKGEVRYISFPVGYRMWTKEKTKLAMTADLVTEVMDIIGSERNVCLLCDSFSSCSSLESQTIGKSVTSIGNGAFKSCSKLTSLTIPEGVVSLGEKAFNYCTSLKSITIPETVIDIGNEAFTGCKSLTIYGKKGSYAERYARHT